MTEKSNILDDRTKEEREIIQQLQIALSEAYQRPRCVTINELSDRYMELKHIYEIAGIDISINDFARKTLEMIEEKGEAEFFKTQEGVQRLISTSEI